MDPDSGRKILRPEYNMERIPGYPYSAQGDGVHELIAGEFCMPVSLQVRADGRFGLSGIQERNGKGAIISGKVSGDVAKINHIILDEELRDSAGTFQGVAEALLADLETELEMRDVKIIYAVFIKTQIVKFLLQHGYEVMSIASLPEDVQKRLQLNPMNFNKRVNNTKEFLARPESESTYQVVLLNQILLRKEIGMPKE